MRSLRRQRARIEARGGALWVREQVLGGSGGFETGVVLRQLDEFGFRSVEDLEGALEEVEALKSRHAAVSRELGKVRERFSESAEEELHDLEQRLAESSESVGFAEAVQEGAELGESLREVAGWLGRGEAELAGLVLSDLEPYLMDLSSGQLTRPSVGAGGWSVCVDQDPNPCLLAHASAGTRARFELALRFALVEQMLERGHFPMLIGPEFPAELGSEFWPEVAQALSRLAAGVQVVQTAPLGGPWGDLASAIHPV